MSVTEWSESIMIARLSDEPGFSDDVESLERELQQSEDGPRNVILDFSNVSYLNSSNIAQLLNLRKLVQEQDRRLRICSVKDRVWSVFLVTGLDKVFEFSDDVTTSLASLQISDSER